MAGTACDTQIKRAHLLKFQKYKRRQVITCVKCGGGNAALLYALRHVLLQLDVYIIQHSAASAIELSIILRQL